jgi:hypothetical protein
MRIKVNDEWYDGEDQPVMVELTDQDKINIANMDKECKKYCARPNEGYTSEQILEWMKA